MEQEVAIGTPSQRTVLDNGVRVVTESIPGMRSLSIAVSIECGSADESAEEAGLSHLCEHLVFQGTSTRSRLRIARQIDDAGGQVGAFTSRDYTCYTAAVLGEYSFHALDLLGDLVLNPTFPEQALEFEKRAVLAEIARAADEPSRRAQELAWAACWPDHPLGRPIAGSPELVEGYTREDVIYFFHRHYSPNRTIISAAGNLKHDEFVSQVQDVFWRMYGESSRPRVGPAGFHGGAHGVDIPSAQSYFCLALPAPEYSSPDRYAVHALCKALGGNLSSRLFRRLREERGLVYEVSSDYNAYRGGGLVSIEGSAHPELLAETLGETTAVARDLLTGAEPIELEELWRVRTQIRSEHLLSSESTHTRMMRLAVQEIYFGRQMPSTEILDAVQELDLEPVHRGGRQCWGTGPMAATLVVAGPGGTEAAAAARSLIEETPEPGSPAETLSPSLKTGKEESACH
ncbi:MAG: pitrilysin family protein [Bryobacteraceae bacterium]